MFLLIPTIVAGGITFGLFTQIINAFENVRRAFEYLASAWPEVVELLSVYGRLRTFERVLLHEAVEEAPLSGLVRARKRLWIRAGLTSAVLHVLALLGLGSAMTAHTGRRDERPASPEAAITVKLVEWSMLRRGETSEKHHVEPQRPVRAVAAPSTPAARPHPVFQPVDTASQNGSVDPDGIYRVPFRDASGQAYASLRGGLGCAHVNIQALPDALRTLCEAATRRDLSEAEVTSFAPHTGRLVGGK